jgi:hypothetical protein
MSVMNAGKKSKALVRPLRAGNSRAGERPGRIRAGEPGAAASRPEKRNLPGVSAPARPDKAVPGRPRAAGKSPARPRLRAVPDAPWRAAAEPGGHDRGPASAPAGRGPGSSPPADNRPGATGSAGSGPRMGGDTPARRTPGAGSIPLVPRPRVAPDELIPGRPGAPWDGPGWPGPGEQDQAAGRTRARPRRPAPLVPGQPGPRRDVPARRARVIRPASALSRTPAGRGRRTRLTRRGRRVLWAASVLLLVAVITPLWLALASGAQASSHGLPPSAVRAGMRQVVVRPGQSLWSVAQNAEPRADPRVVIQQIMEFNALGSQVVVPGESLWVPRG